MGPSTFATARCGPALSDTRRRTGARCTLLLALLLAAGAGQALEVRQITPAGEDVPAGQQVVVQFDRPVVALGSEPDPFPAVRIRPRPRCQWRWLTPSALACQLDAEHALETATRYSVSVDAGWQALDGSRLQREVQHQFVTERPRVDWLHFDTWLSPALPLLRVAFTQPVSRDSVAAHLFISDGSRRFAVAVAAGQEAGRQLLAGSASPEQMAHAALLASRPARVWLLRPRQPLPADVDLGLQVEPGLRAAGPEAGNEQRTVLALRTFPAFRFLGFTCTHVHSGDQVQIEAAAEPGPRVCDPLAGVSLDFSAPAPAASVARGLRLSPDLAAGRRDFDPWENAAEQVYLGRPHAAGERYQVWLPAGLKAFETYRARSGPDSVDAFGRPLAHAMDAALATAHRRPRLALVHPQSVLEAGVDSELAVYVTNLSSVGARYRTLDAAGRRLAKQAELPVPDAVDVSFPLPLGVRQMLEGRSGAVSGVLQSVPEDRDGPVHFFSQVTPFAVSAKLGHFNTVVWITDFASGEPVAGARVRIYAGIPHELSEPGAAPLATAVSDDGGLATLAGTESLDPDLSLVRRWQRDKPALLLRVDHGEDMALLPLTGEFRVWTRQVWPELRPRLGHLRAWGTTAQGIYRLGEDVDYKLYLRHQDSQGLVAAPPVRYRLRIMDPKDQPLAEPADINLSRFGAHHGRLRIPDSAAVGWYRFQIMAGEDGDWLDAFRVLVSDFTPSPFKVRTTADRERVAPGDALEIRADATLHAGGPFTGGLVRTVARLVPRAFDSDRPAAAGFSFSTPNAESQLLFDDSAQLDPRGEQVFTLILPDSDFVTGAVEIETSVRDDRGKSVAARTRVQWQARDRMVGLRATGWLYRQGEVSTVEALVVDAAGEPVAGVPVALAVERLETFTARVKGAGNAYIERHDSRWVASSDCALRSALQPVACHFAAAEAGYHRFVARVADSQGREHRSILHAYVTGDTRVQWAGSEDGALDIVPEKTGYQVGEQARFLVKNPYPGATALISIERYGVLRHFTRTLEGSTPVIEFPIEPQDAPGFYLGVTLVSPRAAAPLPGSGQLDLGKPALRVGYLQVAVAGEPARLEVSARAEPQVLKPRQTVRLEFQVPPEQAAMAASGDADAGVELAVVVLDEAVLELLAEGKRGFDPHLGFNRLQDLDVVSFSLLSRLIGRQKFERKGASSGGDGATGALALRDLFRFVAYWNPALPTDERGQAAVTFTVPDNLTGWRVLAMAVTPGAAMGLGEIRFVVNTPTELRPVMPNQLSAGDRAVGGFSLLNRSDTQRQMEVVLGADGSAVETAVEARQQVTLAAFARTRVWLPVHAVREGEIRFTARAGDALDTDAVEHRLPVRRRSVTERLASYGVLEDTEVRVAVATQREARPGSTRLEVDLSASVLANLDGAFRYMRDYPYACWEQRLSKSTMAGQYARLAAYLDPELAWPGAATLPAAAMVDAARFQAPDGGMCYWAASNDRVSPYLSAYTALAFGWLADSGVQVPAQVEQRLHGYLRTLLRKDVAPTLDDAGMAATVRAVALAALARRQALPASDLHRYESHVPQMTLFGKAHFLQAVIDVEGDSPLARATLQTLLGHSQRSGGRLALNEPAGDGYAAMHSSAARSECAALSSLVRASAVPGYAESLAQLGTELARAVVAARGSQPQWRSTQENMFCMNALADYARRYESTPVAAEVKVLLDDTLLGRARLDGLRAPPARVSAASPALPANVRLQRNGQGRIYWKTLLAFEPLQPPSERINAGLTVRRELSVRRDGRWLLLAPPAQVRRGEVVRVDLYVSAPARRHFVVVDDPVAGGLEPVDSNLATAAAGDTLDGTAPAAQLDPRAWWFRRTDWIDFATRFDGFYHRELQHHAVRFFADTLDAGNYHLSYTAQAIAAGEFQLAPARVEEMYDPEVYGSGLPLVLRVNE